MRVADYIASYLVERGVDECFTVVGGGAMHLNDAFGHEDGMRCTYHHNEQACSTAAEGYARACGKIALCCVTTGPGGTNAITGVLGSWLDSIPMLVISGQVKYETTVRASGRDDFRQLGDQEFDITRCVNTMTKYAEMIIDPLDIRYHLDKALLIARSGRPGPVWLDIPLNVQGSIIETDDLHGFDPALESLDRVPHITKRVVDEVVRKLASAKRPVLYVGTGIHLASAEEKLVSFAESVGIPVCCGFSAHDIMYYDHPLYIGRPGTIGDRAGNFAVQNSDLLLVLGCRLNIRQTGYYFESFARGAYKIMVDIDAAELHKPMVPIDMPIWGDVSEFLDLLAESCKGKLPRYRDWLAWCTQRKEKYPTCLSSYYDKKEPVNPYCLMDELGKQAQPGTIMVASNASACICSFQTLKLKKGQRLFSNSGLAQMGYGLPAAIGAARVAADRGEQVFCFEGDGSLQMNIQELQTVVTNRLPIKIFYLNNGGYHSIRQTQGNFFNGNLAGCTPESGVGFPDMSKVAPAYGLPYVKISSTDDLGSTLEKVLAASSAMFCEVLLDAAQPFAPRSSSRKLDDGRMISRPLEDLAPFLPRDEYENNLLIPPLDEQ